MYFTSSPFHFLLSLVRSDQLLPTDNLDVKWSILHMVASTFCCMQCVAECAFAFVSAINQLRNPGENSESIGFAIKEENFISIPTEYAWDAIGCRCKSLCFRLSHQRVILLQVQYWRFWRILMQVKSLSLFFTATQRTRPFSALRNLWQGEPSVTNPNPSPKNGIYQQKKPRKQSWRDPFRYTSEDLPGKRSNIIKWQHLSRRKASGFYGERGCFGELFLRADISAFLLPTG